MEAGGGVSGHDLSVRGTAEIRALATWAERTGWLDSNYYLTQAREGGLEHRLWLDEASGRVIKVTLPGFCGRTVRLVDPATEKREIHRLVRFGPATPLEYLDRLALHNALFGRSVRVLGVVCDPARRLSIVISQVFLHGTLPREAEVRRFMHGAGFAALGAEPAYFRAYDRVAAFDAHTANFVRTRGETVPFDVITFHADAAMARVLASFA